MAAAGSIGHNATVWGQDREWSYCVRRADGTIVEKGRCISAEVAAYFVEFAVRDDERAAADALWRESGVRDALCAVGEAHVKQWVAKNAPEHANWWFINELREHVHSELRERAHREEERRSPRGRFEALLETVGIDKYSITCHVLGSHQDTARIAQPSILATLPEKACSKETFERAKELYRQFRLEVPELYIWYLDDRPLPPKVPLSSGAYRMLCVE